MQRNAEDLQYTDIFSRGITLTWFKRFCENKNELELQSIEAIFEQNYINRPIPNFQILGLKFQLEFDFWLALIWNLDLVLSIFEMFV